MKKNKRKIEIFCTLGPSSLNKKFLKKIKRNITLVRLNLSHIKTSQLSRQIRFIKKFTKVTICNDTEGAQIRTKVTRAKFFKKNSLIEISKLKNQKQLSNKDATSLIEKNKLKEELEKNILEIEKCIESIKLS